MLYYDEEEFLKLLYSTIFVILNSKAFHKRITPNVIM